jgi:hypothetical protein
VTEDREHDPRPTEAQVLLALPVAALASREAVVEVLRRLGCFRPDPEEAQ